MCEYIRFFLVFLIAPKKGEFFFDGSKMRMDGNAVNFLCCSALKFFQAWAKFSGVFLLHSEEKEI